MVTDSATFERAVREFAARPLDLDLRAARVRILAASGVDADAPVLIAGGQPLMFGGTPKVLGKLLMLRFIKRRIGTCRTVYYSLVNDTARSDREFYRSLRPTAEGDRWIGFQRLKLPSGVPALRIVISQQKRLEMLRRLESWFGADLPEPFCATAADGDISLAEWNLAVLRAIARVLDLEPDYWLDDKTLDDAVLHSSILDHLLIAIRELAPRFNDLLDPSIPPLRDGEAPFWIHRNGEPKRLAATIVGDSVAFDSERVTLEALRANEHVTLTMRAVPRIVALSVILAGQITGSGSHYNRVLESAAAETNVAVMPRLALTSGVFRYSNDSPSRACNEYGIADLFRHHPIEQVRDRIRAVLERDRIDTDAPPIVDLTA